MSEAGGCNVLVMVGTDHHRFDRLVRWIDGWAAQGPRADVFVQHGSAPAPTNVAAAPSLDHGDLARRVAEADVVVCHGGLSSIMETRAAGFLPVVVARDPGLGEHVDGHQQAFTAHEAAQGRIHLVTDEAALRAALDQAITDPAAFRLDRAATERPEAVDRVGSLIDDLIARRAAAHPAAGRQRQAVRP